MLHHPVLFYGKLRLIGDMAQRAASALAVYAAIGVDTVGRRGEQLLHNAIAKVFLQFYKACAQLVPNSGAGHKHCKAIYLANAVALIGDIGNFYVYNFVF